ncbi:hypothetical protein [Lacticaseibacillus daqingensis]|uniref:hypothetical protein n=1 Tax=Lacticaseibacillus daqingensis TaxID=2486014 RepID=UPI000F77EDA9|nr:hypothetical protein [Lacticaseibacillus daqingensis]
MKKLTTILITLVAAVTLGGCQQPAKTPTTHSTKTMITSKQYTIAQLRERYVTVTDVAVKPLDLASYKQPEAKLKAAIQSGQKTLARVRLTLVSNITEKPLTDALLKYLDAADQMLTLMTGTDQTAYNAAAKAFSTQCSAIGKTYFGGQLPDSIVNYSKRMNP